jgi:enterochelin esterase-like enzyme
MSLGGGITAFAADTTEGTNVTADPTSPTGYTVTFVYHNPNAEQVKLGGDLSLLDSTTGGAIRIQPEGWKTGMYHTGGTEFLRDMVKDADGNWSVTIPMHAGALSYWYRVWDSSQGWTNKRIWDPASPNIRPVGTDDNSTPFRVRNNNDVLDAVYVPYDAKQNDPTLESRATYQLPVADSSKKGTVQYIKYTTILGGEGFNLGVYLPAGYDANRAEPYKVVYAAHGIFGDETDWMIPGSAPNILDNMIARGEIEPTVFITMGNHFTDQSLGFNSYNRQNAADNLVQTILPKIEAEYNVSKERTGRAYIGFSMGGMTGSYVMNSYANSFGYYGFFSGNGTYTQENYDNIAAVSGANVPFVFMGRGSFEGNLDAINAIRDNFRSRGIPSESVLVAGAHDMMTAAQQFTIFAKDHLWTQVEALKSFTITTDGVLDRVGGLRATVNVDLTEGAVTHSGQEVVLFQLMKGSTPVNIVALQRDITAKEEFTAYFNVDPKDSTYSVRAFVFDRFNNDLTAPISLADGKVLN